MLKIQLCHHINIFLYIQIEVLFYQFVFIFIKICIIVFFPAFCCFPFTSLLKLWIAFSLLSASVLSFSALRLCGFEPFFDPRGDQYMYSRILNCDYEFVSPWWDEVSLNARDLVSTVCSRISIVLFVKLMMFMHCRLFQMRWERTLSPSKYQQLTQMLIWLFNHLSFPALCLLTMSCWLCLFDVVCRLVSS